MRWTAEGSERLDVFLARQLPEHSRAKLARAIGDGRVTVDGVVRKPSFKLSPGDAVEVAEVPASAPHDLSPAEVPLRIVFEDASLIVVDKPRGLPVHPAPSIKGPTLVNALLGRGTELSQGAAEFRPGIVHRLDKDTTGLIVVAKTDEAHRKLSAQIASKTAERRYLAVVTGDWLPPKLRIEGPIGRDPHHRLKMAVVPNGKPAVTHVAKLGPRLLGLRLETGRTHQIRVHLAATGHPVVGDLLYGGGSEAPLQLHAAALAIRHPLSAETMWFFADPPADFLLPADPRALREAFGEGRVET